MRGALTRRFFRNLEIPRSRPRLGQAAGRSHAGSPHSLSRENESTIFESISGGVTAFYVQAAECAFFFCGLPAAIGPVLLSSPARVVAPIHVTEQEDQTSRRDRLQ